MTHLLLLVGGWAGSTGVASGPPHFGTVQAFALGLTLALMAGLWWLAERHQRELRAQRDGRVVPFADPRGNQRRFR